MAFNADVDARRLRDHIAKTIRHNCQDMIVQDPEVARANIQKMVEEFLARTIEDMPPQLEVCVRSGDNGQFVAVIRGPRELFGGLFGVIATDTGVKDPRYYTVKGTRSNGKQSWQVAVTMTVVDGQEPGTKVLKVTDGGVTGFESFYITDDLIIGMSECGWRANFGVGHRDELVIEAAEMRQLFDSFGLLGMLFHGRRT